jgi:hypothetical protein
MTPSFTMNHPALSSASKSVIRRQSRGSVIGAVSPMSSSDVVGSAVGRAGDWAATLPQAAVIAMATSVTNTLAPRPRRLIRIGWSTCWT